MRSLSLILALLSLTATAAEIRILPPTMRAPDKANRLFCKTGPEMRAANQPLELYLQYFLPILFEPEDPTAPYGRQAVALAGRPSVQIHFRKSAEPAGERGEKLEPMSCAFAKRMVTANEPSRVQVLLPSGQPHWLTQSLGQRPGPRQTSFEHSVLTPAGDWAFASQFDKVFYVDLDDAKNFVTTQLPKAL